LYVAIITGHCSVPDRAIGWLVGWLCVCVCVCVCDYVQTPESRLLK